MSEIKQYEITTIADLLQIPDDKLDDCLADLKIWIGIRKEFNALPEFLREYLNLSDVFVWKDDGIRGISQIRLNISKEKNEH